MCERAVAIGLPAVVFTEHFDFDDVWRTTRDDLMPHQQSLLDPDGISGHRHWRCRVTSRASTVAVVDSPELTILTGVEFGQPHLFGHRAAELVDLSTFDRVNGSLHTLKVGDDRYEPNTLFRMWPADDVMRAYLEEIPPDGRRVR